MRATLASGVPLNVTFRAVDCLAGCDHPIAVGVQGQGKAAYLFGGIETDEDIDAIGEFALQYHDCCDGWSSSTDRPAALRDKTLARLPALPVVSTP